MINWNPVHYKNNNSRSPNEVLIKCLKIVQKFQDKPYPVVLTLGHLSARTKIPYKTILKILNNRLDYYTFYKIRKRNGKDYRMICHPFIELKYIQQWINKYILMPNKNCLNFEYAYIQGKSAKQCAELHSGAYVLLKLDIQNYFDSISEIQVYHFFNQLGYSKLVSFQLARLCTIPFGNSKKIIINKRNKIEVSNKIGAFLRNKKRKSVTWHQKKYLHFSSKYFGHLPQGAPSSPMLANLITANMDKELSELLNTYNDNLVYSRYADDIFISSKGNIDKIILDKIITSVRKILIKYGFDINKKKTKIFFNGKRKEILGININDNKLHLPQKFKKKLECHLYYFNKDPLKHCQNRKFETIIGLINYLNGLITYAKYIEPSYIEKLINHGYLLDDGKLDTSKIL